MKKRSNEFDLLKCIGIVSVIFGHLVPYLPFKICIYSFHMPLFFFISGYFLKPRTFRRQLAKSINGLVVPYLYTCIVMLIIKIVKYGFSYELVEEWFLISVYAVPSNAIPGKHMGIKQVGPIWFLLALFWAQIYVQMIRKIKTGWKIVFVSLGMALAIIIGNKIWLPFAILNGAMGAFFVFAGNECAKPINYSNALDEIQKSIFSSQSAMGKILEGKRFSLVVAITIWGTCIILDCFRRLNFSLSIFQFPLYGLGILGALAAIFTLYFGVKVIGKHSNKITSISEFVGGGHLEYFVFILLTWN